MRGLILFRRQLHLISRSETSIIKPASPTPQKFKQYNLPLHDRMTPNVYVPAIFFYTNINNSADHKSSISNLLKNSLSEALSKYYPLAGRLRSSGSYVDCNDEGVHFVEAQIGCKLSHILEKTTVKEESDVLSHLFQPHKIWDKLSDEYSSLICVQLNHFTCGGTAITVSFSHRIGDALTLFSFVTYWAGLSRHSGDHQKLLHLCPYIVYELLPKSCDDSAISAHVSFPEKQFITKEIVFHNSNIAKLKANMEVNNIAQGTEELNHTRNELVTALLYRCAVAAAATSNSGVYEKSVLCQTINMRPMIDPPLPQTSLGNLITLNHIPTTTENETKLNLLVDRMRKGRMQLRGSKGMNEALIAPIFEEYAKSNHRMYCISSICNFPLYEIDFGWGRPVNAKLLVVPVVDCMIIMDTPSGDGIKAIVGLEEKEMKNFQADREMLTYASF